jgi:hypothetical protein
MPLTLSLRRVPWTCRWGRFGGPVEPRDTTPHGFVFWFCMHPDLPAGRLLDRGSCELCPMWEPAAEFDEARTA